MDSLKVYRYQGNCPQEQKLYEMNELFRHAVQIACSLNLPFDRIQAVRTAVGGLNDPTLYANNIKPSQGLS